MWGTLVVTRDVEAWLAAHPEAGGVPQAPAAGHVHGK